MCLSLACRLIQKIPLLASRLRTLQYLRKLNRPGPALRSRWTSPGRFFFAIRGPPRRPKLANEKKSTLASMSCSNIKII
jgi:hypothetical protein